MSKSCSRTDCNGCPTASECGDRRSTGPMTEELNPRSRVGKVVGVVSGKGGVGKSLVTGLMAAESQHSGLNAAVLDADITGPSVAKMFGVTEKALGGPYGIYSGRTESGIQIMSMNMLLEDETEPVVWRGPVLASAVKQFWTDVIWDDVDVMYLDLPPGTGDIPLTVYQSIPLDGIVVVSTPQELVSMIVDKALKMAEMMGVPILGFVQNMAYVTCPNCEERIEVFGPTDVQAISEKLGLDAVDTLPINQNLARLSDEGRFDQAPPGLLPNIMKAVDNVPARRTNGN